MEIRKLLIHQNMHPFTCLDFLFQLDDLYGLFDIDGCRFVALHDVITLIESLKSRFAFFFLKFHFWMKNQFLL